MESDTSISNANLSCEVKDKIEEVSSPAITKEESERNFAASKQSKEEGNAYFRTNDFDNALEAYSRAIDLCPDEFPNDLVRW